jgi:CubicO group peptidase (beta-lactamase class C family)
VLLSKIKFLLLHMRFAFTIVSLSVIALNLSAQTNTQNLPKPAAQTAAQSVSPLKDVAVPAKIDTLISAYAALNQFNGTILVTQGANTIFRKVYGFRDAEKKIKLGADDLFQLGSLTKSFTSILIMQLIEEKKLSLDNKLTDFFPAIHPEKMITIAQLLNHTSGIREELRDPAFRAKVRAGKEVTRQEMLDYYSHQPLDFEPGSTFAYSNSGYNLLGMIIEKLRGLSYEQVIRQRIFHPLGMTGSGFNYPRLKSKYKTKGYAYLSPTRIVPATVWAASGSYSSGALYSNARDLALWNKALKDNKLITAYSLEKTYTAVKGGYGYGWFIDSLYGKKIVSHAGNVEGGTSYFARIPADDICIIMLINQTSTTLENIGDKIIALLYGRDYKLPKPKQAIALSAEMATKYAGVYDISDDYRTTISYADHQLFLSTNNQPAVRILPESATRFFINDSDMVLTFSRNAEGKVHLAIREGLWNGSGDKMDLQ